MQWNPKLRIRIQDNQLKQPNFQETLQQMPCNLRELSPQALQLQALEHTLGPNPSGKTPPSHPGAASCWDGTNPEGTTPRNRPGIPEWNCQSAAGPKA